MKNKRFPNYPDDTDYTTNAPSYYDDLARKQKLIELLSKKIWEYDERLDNRIADLEEVLSSYLSQWDERIENLDNEVSHIFVEWLNDGTLEQIINHDVLGYKADKTYVDSEIERLDQKDETLISQLAQKAEKNEVMLSVFGNDFVNFSDAVDYCKSEQKTLNIDIDIDLEVTETLLIDFELNMVSTNKSKISFDKDLFNVTGKLMLKGITFDQKNNYYYRVANVNSGATIIVDECNFYNFVNKNEPKSCFVFDLENGSFGRFENITVKNIHSIGDGIITNGPGEQRFIRTKKMASNYDLRGYTIIDNIYVENFYNINALNNPILEDSDVFGIQHGYGVNHKTIISNVTCKNVGKRIVKIQSNNVIIENIDINNDTFTDILIAISILDGKNIAIRRIKLLGNNDNTSFIEIFGTASKNITVDDVVLDITGAKTAGGSAFNLEGSAINIRNVSGSCGGLFQINGNSKNIHFNNVDVDIKYSFIVIRNLKNDLSVTGIVFRDVNIKSVLPHNSQLVSILDDNYTVGNVLFDNCNFDLSTTYIYGAINVTNCNDFRVNNTNIKLNESTQLLKLNDTIAEINASEMDNIEISGSTQVMTLASTINNINMNGLDCVLINGGLINNSTFNFYSGASASTNVKGLYVL